MNIAETNKQTKKLKRFSVSFNLEIRKKKQKDCLEKR